MTRTFTVAILVCTACVSVPDVGSPQQPVGGDGLQQLGERIEEGPVYPKLKFPASGVWKSEYDHKLDGKLRVQESTRIEITARKDGKVLTGNYQDHRAVGKENDSVFRGQLIPGPLPVVTLTQTDDPAYTAIYTGKLVSPNRFVGTYVDNQGYSGDWSLELILDANLEPYIGKNLRKLDEHAVEAFRKQVEALTGDAPEKQDWQSYQPWWVKPFTAGDAAWAFLEAYPGYDIPDVSGVQIHVFDKNWKRIAKQSFPTGYRFFLNEVEVVKDNPLKQDLLVAKATSSGPFIVQGDKKHPAFEQGDYQRQYYALLGDRFVMVRLEDNRHRLAQNHYRWSSPPKGPAVPKRTRDEWIRSLSSQNSVEQLATLVWLSGTHLSSTDERHQNASQESLEDSRLLESVRDAEQTRTALRELTKSDNAWVQEYARFTLQVINE